MADEPIIIEGLRFDFAGKDLWYFYNEEADRLEAAITMASSRQDVATAANYRVAAEHINVLAIYRLKNGEIDAKFIQWLMAKKIKKKEES